MEEPEMPCPNTHLDRKGRELALRLPLSWVDAFGKMSLTASNGIFFVKILDPGALVVKWCIQSHRVRKGRKKNHALGVPLAGVFSTSWVFSCLSSRARFVPVDSILNKNIRSGVARAGVSKSLSFLLLTWLFP